MLPLARPGIIASMTLLFILAIRELGSSLFLYTSDTTVMAVLLLDYYEGGNTGKAAAFSLVQTALLAVLIGFANWFSSDDATPASAVRDDDADNNGGVPAMKSILTTLGLAAVLATSAAAQNFDRPS